ncbi:MAG: PRC-barrel domain containing protein [Gaiella sp.]
MNVRTEIWSFRAGLLEGGSSATGLTGYEVVGRDGSIGRVDRANETVGAAHLVVETGGWLHKRDVVLPAAAIESVDHERRVVAIDLLRDELEGAPTVEEAFQGEDLAFENLGDYYRNLPRIRGW